MPLWGKWFRQWYKRMEEVNVGLHDREDDGGVAAWGVVKYCGS